ncbi:hypothetical protein KUL113_61760 [Tenacibaculum sp. KUL113]|nr:hypothetical protein KUL113_61760 [Tenacibaculum sp. KUL113]
MKFYKKSKLLILFIHVLVVSSCSTEKEIPEPVLNVSITNFNPSKNQVSIDWILEKSDDIIIRDLLIIKKAVDHSGKENFSTIANLPQNQTSFTDIDIPHYNNISYKIRVNYFLESTFKEGIHPDIQVKETEFETFTRDLIVFNNVPFQVSKDTDENHIFHLIDRKPITELKKYDFNTQKILKSVPLSENYLQHVVFKIIGNIIYVADTKGNFKVINKDSYEVINSFTVDIKDRLSSFSVNTDRIYYHDKDILKFYDLTKKESVYLGWAYFPKKYMETIGQNTILFEGARVAEFSPTNCVDNNNCWPKTLYTNNGLSGKPYRFDPFIFAWNKNKTKFVSTYFGDIIALNDLSKKVSLKEITGKWYFQIVFDENDNIYATIQEEKLIHVFNANYELIKTIKTEEYPLFPMITKNGLQCISSYRPIQYSGYVYGHEFSFNQQYCIIEEL